MEGTKLLAPWWALAGVFAIGNVGAAISAAYTIPLRPGFLLLYFIGVQWALAWWVLLDCRRYRISTSIDHGWFVFVAWPLALPYHLIRTRGARGFLVMAGMVGLFVAAYLVALVAFFILSRL